MISKVVWRVLKNENVVISIPDLQAVKHCFRRMETRDSFSAAQFIQKVFYGYLMQDRLNVSDGNTSQFHGPRGTTERSHFIKVPSGEKKVNCEMHCCSEAMYCCRQVKVKCR